MDHYERLLWVIALVVPCLVGLLVTVSSEYFEPSILFSVVK
jgi:hypothetical protein